MTRHRHQLLHRMALTGWTLYGADTRHGAVVVMENNGQHHAITGVTIVQVLHEAQIVTQAGRQEIPPATPSPHIDTGRFRPKNDGKGG